MTKKTLIEGKCGCRFYEDASDTKYEDDFFRVNNLICDFYHNKLVISEKESHECTFSPELPHTFDHYWVELTKRHFNVTNHATCQCSVEDMIVEETTVKTTATFCGQHLTDHIHMFVNGTEVRAFFHGVDCL